MELRIQLLAIIGSAAMFVFVLELVRRKAFLERYALLWLFSSLVLLGLAVWNDALSTISTAIGIRTPSNALFLIAFGFVLVLLLHFSLAVSRLSDQTKVLAQRVGLLQQRLDLVEGRAESRLEDEQQQRRAADDREELDAELHQSPCAVTGASSPGCGTGRARASPMKIANSTLIM